MTPAQRQLSPSFRSTPAIQCVQHKPRQNNNEHSIGRGEYWKSSDGRMPCQPFPLGQVFPFPLGVVLYQRVLWGQQQGQYRGLAQLSLHMWGQRMEMGKCRTLLWTARLFFVLILALYRAGTPLPTRSSWHTVNRVVHRFSIWCLEFTSLLFLLSEDVKLNLAL